MSVRYVKTMAASTTCAALLVLGTAAMPLNLLGVALADEDTGGTSAVSAPAPDDSASTPAPADQPPLELLAAEGTGAAAEEPAVAAEGPVAAAEGPVATVPADAAPLPGGRTHPLADGATTAPAGVAAAVLLPGMDPAFLTINPDGSLVYHGTTPVGVETPGWSVIAGADGIDMVHGPVGPAPAPAPDATPLAAAEGSPAADVAP